jgi:flagellar motor switch protein FliG
MVETGLKRLRRAAPDVLMSVLRGEHPQTLALILAHLDIRQAAGVIEAMEPELAADVLFRVARMEKVSPEMLALVETGLGSKADLSLSQEMTLSGGPSSVANVLNLTTPSLEKTLMEALGVRDADLANQIKGLMFVFEDLKLLDGRAMQRVLRDIESKELALALKAASDELKQHILKNMSERAAAALTEEMEYLGPVKVKDVEAAHLRIVQSVRALEEAGEIVISGRGGADDVIA